MVSQLVSHSTYLLIALVAIAMILASFSAFRSNIEKVSTESNLNLIGDMVKQEILKLYSSSEESGKIEIPVQSKLGEKPFIITLSQNKIVVEMNGFQIEKKVLINANLEGRASLPAFILLRKDAGVKTISLVTS